MTWAKVDDRFPRHPKSMKGGPLVRDLYVCGLCYVNEHLTDGFIPDYAVAQLAPGLSRPRKIAQRLVDLRLWEAVEGGYQIHDFHEFNDTAEVIRAKRAATRLRVSQWRERQKGNAVTNGVGNAVTNSVSNAPPTPTPTPTPTKQERHTPPPAASGVTNFEAFWEQYPKKEARANAEKAWKKLKPDAALVETIMAALVVQKGSEGWQRENGRYITHPATWLNGKRWTDQVSSNGIGSGRSSRVTEIHASGERAKALIRQTQGAME